MKKGSRVAGNQLLHDCQLEEGQKPKSEGRGAYRTNAVERARACHAARNTGAEKSKQNT